MKYETKEEFANALADKLEFDDLDTRTTLQVVELVLYYIDSLGFVIVQGLRDK